MIQSKALKCTEACRKSNRSSQNLNTTKHAAITAIAIESFSILKTEARRQCPGYQLSLFLSHVDKASVAIAGTGSFKAAPERIKLSWTTQHAHLCACIPFEDYLYYLQYLHISTYIYHCIFDSLSIAVLAPDSTSSQGLCHRHSQQLTQQSLPAGSSRSSPIVTTSRGIPGTITTLSSLYRNPWCELPAHFSKWATLKTLMTFQKELISS